MVEKSKKANLFGLIIEKPYEEQKSN